MKRTFLTPCLLTLCLLALAISTATNASDAATLAADCNDCHGADGVSEDSDVPTIAGLSYTYLEDNLGTYAAEGRPCEESMMCDFAMDLSEDDVAALSEHYESLAFVPAKQEFDAALAAQGAAIHEANCEKCHTEGGSVADDDAGILAGQWTPYLRLSFDEFKTGKRAMSDQMAEKLKPLKAEELEALLNFYASNAQ